VHIEGLAARVRMTMTSAACPVADMIIEEVQAEVEGLVSRDATVEVELCWEPPWSPELMSERARRFIA
jgi:metal-sulfur cluster biosynthetic enzyme